jgi:hypothetical protein
MIRPEFVPSTGVAGVLLVGSGASAQAGGSPASGTAVGPPVDTVSGRGR